MPLDDLVPDSTAAALALEVAERFHSPALLNHCRRSHLWAAEYARARGIAVDAELLYVAAMLHDIGLVPAFDSATLRSRRPGEPSRGCSPPEPAGTPTAAAAPVR